MVGEKEETDGKDFDEIMDDAGYIMYVHKKSKVVFTYTKKRRIGRL